MRYLLACLSFLLALSGASAEEKGFGFVYSIKFKFNCPLEEQLSDGQCKDVPPPEKIFVYGVEVRAIVCDGAVDRAKIRLGDFLLEVNGQKVSGMNLVQFEDFMTAQTRKDENSWTIARKTVFGSVETRQVKVVPMPIGDDYSCGKPDEDS